jgi:hypothetical protein
MKAKRLVSIFLSGVAASALGALPSHAGINLKENTETRIFECKKIGENYTTTMNRDNRNYSIIVWRNDNLVGYDNNLQYARDVRELVPPEYVEQYRELREQLVEQGKEDFEANMILPHERCESVSSRLNTVFRNYQISPPEFALTLNHGRLFLQVRIQGETKFISPTVICAGDNPCDQDNMLFTISGENAENPTQIMHQLVNLINNPGEYAAIRE